MINILASVRLHKKHPKSQTQNFWGALCIDTGILKDG